MKEHEIEEIWQEGIPFKECQPQLIIQAIRRELELGDLRRARAIAAAGNKLHPGDKELEKYAQVLAPPTVRRVITDEKEEIALATKLCEKLSEQNIGWSAVNYKRNQYRGYTFEVINPKLDIQALMPEIEIQVKYSGSFEL